MRAKFKFSFTVKLTSRQAVQFIEKAMLMGLTPDQLMDKFVTQVGEIGIGNNSPLGKWMSDNKTHTERTEFLRFLFFKGLLGDSIVKWDVVLNMKASREISSREGQKEIDIEVKKLSNELLSLYNEYAGDNPEALSFDEAMDALKAYEKLLKRFFKVDKNKTEQAG